MSQAIASQTKKRIPYEINQMTFMEKIGMVLFSVWFHVFKFFWTYWFGFILALVSLATYPFHDVIRKRARYIFVNLWARGVVYGSLAKYELHIAPEVDFKQTYVYVGNHTSSFDIYLWQVAIKNMFNWMAKRSLFNMPFVGTAMWCLGHIPIYRHAENSIAEGMRNIRTAVAKLNRTYSVGIFPEGTRSVTGELLPFKKGAFLIAKIAKVPLVPIVIQNASNVWRKGRFWINPYVPIIINVLAPMDSSDKNSMDNVKNKIQSVLDSSKQERI